jgi:23S rRNA (cytosine1962-C5)-methyltransferase
MKKPPRNLPAADWKAPKAHTPEAPGSIPPKTARQAERRERKGNSSSIETRPAPAAPTGARISRRAADRLRSGHLWVYASDIESIQADEQNPPALLPVADNRGLLLGTALYSPSSQIALRLVSREAIDEAGWLQLLATRLRAAIARRRPLLTADTNACRLVFSEADQLPGLVADVYGELVILQLLARGLDSAAVRSACAAVLREELDPAAILERPDPRVRELEGLSAPGLAPLWARDADSPLTRTTFRLNGLELLYDASAGQKTGAFLDQRANYAAAADWAMRLGATSRGSGRALDVFCYQGGFALHLARVCRQVTGVDASRASLEVAEQNLAANRQRLTAEVDWVEGDAFEILREWSDAGGPGRQYDAIVLDPPAFAKSKRAVEGALRGYKELNLRGLKMVRPGGLLVTCSCSHHVGWADLEGAVASAAADAHRRVRFLERRGAAHDHPVILNLPETEYLKCLVLEVE